MQLSLNAPARAQASNRQSGGRSVVKHTFVPAVKIQSSRIQLRDVALQVQKTSLGSLVGEKVPNFELIDVVSNSPIDLYEYTKGAPATLLMFVSCHCPFVKMLKENYSALAKEYQARGVKVIAINSNSIETHPQDGPDSIRTEAKEFGYTFPCVYDENQDVAKAYQAACTPEFLVLDSSLVLKYHGQYDASRPSKYGESPPTTGVDVRNALEAVLASKPIEKMAPAIGCNIKWHPGKEPAWFGA